MNPGFTFANRFTIHHPAQDLLGRGGMGDIYRATDAQTGDAVAVKLLDQAEEKGHPYLVTEFVEGGRLQDLLTAQGRRTGNDFGTVDCLCTGR